MTLGTLVKDYRTNHRLSMDEFARSCPLSKGYISMIENGINPRNQKPIAPTLSSLEKLANGMHMDLDVLLRQISSEEPAPLKDNVLQFPRISSSDDSEILSIYDELSPENRSKLSEYASQLLSEQRSLYTELSAANDRGATYAEKCSADELMMDDSEWE